MSLGMPMHLEWHAEHNCREYNAVGGRVAAKMLVQAHHTLGAAVQPARRACLRRNVPSVRRGGAVRVVAPGSALSTQQAAAPPAAPAPQPEAAEAPASTSAAPTPVKKQLCLRSAACNLPHPDKASYGGEDAWFVSEAGGGAIGVADGVGGWAESGINPAEYSRTFMRVACAFIEKQDAQAVASVSSMDSMDWPSPLSSTDDAVVDPVAALDTAHRYTRVPGSATACVVQLCPERRSLIAANLGDSGFLVLRQGKVVVRSSPLQHFFDCPLQFGAFPEHVEATDSADNAEIFNLPVELGDVIIAGSDGLWDNAYEHEILKLAPTGPQDVKAAAKAIAKLARKHAADPTFPSPYTQSAKAQGYDIPWYEKVANLKFEDGQVKLGELQGGKLDDITVLVAVVDEVEVPVAVPAPVAPAPVAAAAAAAADAVAINGTGGSVAAGNGRGSPSVVIAEDGQEVMKATILAPAAPAASTAAAAPEATAAAGKDVAAAVDEGSNPATNSSSGSNGNGSAAAAPVAASTTTTTTSSSGSNGDGGIPASAVVTAAADVAVTVAGIAVSVVGSAASTVVSSLLSKDTTPGAGADQR